MKDQGDGNRCRCQESGASGSAVKGRRDRKGWVSSRLLGWNRFLWCQRCGPPTSVLHRSTRERSSRQINLNKPVSPVSIGIGTDHRPSTFFGSTKSSPAADPPNFNRKQDSFEPIKSTFEQIKTGAAEAKQLLIVKRQKRLGNQGEAKRTDSVEAHSASSLKGMSKSQQKEKERQRKKKIRQKAERRAHDEHHRRMMEDYARQAKAGESGPGRFLVGMPLESISALSGGSVCRNFRRRDLTLNDISPVPLESLLTFPSATICYKSLTGPLYFSNSCKENVDKLKKRLDGAAVCSKLLVVSEEHFKGAIVTTSTPGGNLPRLLGEKTLAAIEQALEDSQPPHELESSQNSEDKIKCLFKPILKSLGLQDIIITTGFSWTEKIGLRSTIDLGTHAYGPKSDAAIIKVLNAKEAKILILFEAYSRLGQSLNTPDDNRTDRVRLLIQGSHISLRDGRPSVVFYLTRDKHMETILIFSQDEEHRKFGYYAEKQPFYNEGAWVDLVCQIVNLI